MVLYCEASDEIVNCIKNILITVKAGEPNILKLESDLVRSVSQSFRSCASKASPD